MMKAAIAINQTIFLIFIILLVSCVQKYKKFS